MPVVLFASDRERVNRQLRANGRSSGWTTASRCGSGSRSDGRPRQPGQPADDAHRPIHDGRLAEDRERLLRRLEAEKGLRAQARLPLPPVPLRSGWSPASGAQPTPTSSAPSRRPAGFHVLECDNRAQGPRRPSCPGRRLFARCPEGVEVSAWPWAAAPAPTSPPSTARCWPAPSPAPPYRSSPGSATRSTARVADEVALAAPHPHGLRAVPASPGRSASTATTCCADASAGPPPPADALLGPGSADDCPEPPPDAERHLDAAAGTSGRATRPRSERGAEQAPGRSPRSGLAAGRVWAITRTADGRLVTARTRWDGHRRGATTAVGAHGAPPRGTPTGHRRTRERRPTSATRVLAELEDILASSRPPTSTSIGLAERARGGVAGRVRRQSPSTTPGGGRAGRRHHRAPSAE